MSDRDDMGTLEAWVQLVLDDSNRLEEDLSEAELHERQVAWYAEFFALAQADPDDPALRERLIDLEGMGPALADEVLDKLREIQTNRP
jgi:endonuclease III